MKEKPIKREDICFGDYGKKHHFEYIGWSYGKHVYYKCIACELIKVGRGGTK